MRLLSVLVRNYRIHREQAVTFDPRRTLIGGPNEAGKSTLVEAIHRALFLKAKGNTEHHRAMLSTSGGRPEVELTFECAGGLYTLRKRFGSSGSVHLTQPSGPPLAGEEAEQELAQLLSVPAVAGRAVQSQWAHLWVWQGKACEDPSAHASSIKDDLLNQLQERGTSALLQSERDTRVASRIAAAYQGIYTNFGKAKAGSELDAAERAVSDARQRRDAAEGRIRALDLAGANLEAARAELPQIEESLRGLEKEQVAIEERFTLVAELEREHLEATHQAKDAAARHETLKVANDRIVKLQGALQRQEKSLAPLEKELAGLNVLSATLHRVALESQRAYDTTTEKSRTLWLQCDLATAQHRLFTLQKEMRQLEEREQRAGALRKRLRELEGCRGRLPALDRVVVRQLQRVEVECEKARHVVASVATLVELLSPGASVSLGGETLRPGEKRIVTEELELTTGEGLRLRISPGGGTTLSAARQQLAEQEKALRDNLSKYAIDSVRKAVELLAEREQLNAEIESTKGQIETLGAEQITGQVAAAAEELVSMKSKIARLRELLRDSPECPDESAARDAAASAQRAVGDVGPMEAAAKAARDIAVQKAEEAGTALTEKQAAFNRQNQLLEEKRAELRVLIQAHGEENSRHDAILLAEQSLKISQARVDAVRHSIEPLQPAMLVSDRKRLQRSMEVARERRIAASNSIAAAEVILRSEGMEDPQATLAATEWELRSAQNRLEVVKHHASAIALLHRCFQEEQRRLSDQFTRPLADKITAYLQCLFGPGASASIELNEECFTGLCIDRGGTSERFRFDALSGGTQEQTAAAVRLAMAEILAADHHGCLPIVFDDAFVFSDPERVQHLQRMLDRAAEAGLQVIVLTCSPGDYAALGAHQVTLRLPADRNPAPSIPNPNDASLVDSSGRDCEPLDAVRATEVEQNRFLDLLRKAGGKSAHAALRENLGLDEPNYERIMQCLVASRQVIVGREDGGSVATADLESSELQ